MENDEFVTNNSYSTEAKTELVRLFLQSNGIKCLLLNTDMVRYSWTLSNAIGGVALQVLDSQYKEVSVLLDKYHNEHKTQRLENLVIWDDQEKCPYCKSIEVSEGYYKLGHVIISAMFLFIPLLFLKKGYRCYKCEKVWLYKKPIIRKS